MYKYLNSKVIFRVLYFVLKTQPLFLDHLAVLCVLAVYLSQECMNTHQIEINIIINSKSVVFMLRFYLSLAGP